MNSSANNFLSMLQKVAKEQFDMADQIDIGTVVNQNEDGTYNITLLTDEDTVIHNIPNGSTLQYSSGNKVYIIKVNNQIANAFIIFGSGKDQFNQVLKASQNNTEAVRSELVKLIGQIQLQNSYVEANPVLSGSEANLISISINGVKYNIPTGGTTVIANPTLVGTEDYLESIEISSEKFKLVTTTYVQDAINAAVINVINADY